MANPDRRRRVRVDQFKKQFAEEVIGADSLIELEIGKGEIVTIHIPIDPEEAQELVSQLRDVGDDLTAGALVVLAGNPVATAEEQLEKWLDKGFTIPDLMQIYATESQGVRDRAGKFRYRG